MGSSLSYPVTGKHLLRSENWSHRIGCAMMQGKRDKMEDTYFIDTCIESLGSWFDRRTFLGVYDGHNNKSCAEWLSKQFCNEIMRSIADDDGTALPAANNAASEPPTDEQFIRAFLAADKKFCDSVKSSEKLSESGSTAVVAFIDNQPTTLDGETFYNAIVMHVGDSSALVLKGTDLSLVSLTKAHKPLDDAERDRIEKAGGSVTRTNRVDDKLAMSRAFGDAFLKDDPDLSQVEQKVIAVPSICRTRLFAGDMLLLFSDGINEAPEFDNPRIAAFLKGEFVTREVRYTHDPAMLCAVLCDEALRAGSTDNMTAMLTHIGGAAPFSVCWTLPPLLEAEFLPGLIEKALPSSADSTRAYIDDVEVAGSDLNSAVERVVRNMSEGYYPPPPLPILDEVKEETCYTRMLHDYYAKFSHQFALNIRPQPRIRPFTIDDPDARLKERDRQDALLVSQREILKHTIVRCEEVEKALLTLRKACAPRMPPDEYGLRSDEDATRPL